MKYERIKTGRFLERPNRFIAYIEIDGVKETVHVKNTGRCAELLVPGAEVYVQKSDNPERKTQWDLIGVKKGETTDQYGFSDSKPCGGGVDPRRKSISRCHFD